MDLVMKKDSHHIFKKRNGRHAVRTPKKTWLNGNEKLDFLMKAGLIEKTSLKAAGKAPEKVAGPSKRDLAEAAAVEAEARKVAAAKADAEAAETKKKRKPEVTA
jgi:hypothetical protein